MTIGLADLDFLREGIDDKREYLALERLLLFAQSHAEGLQDPVLAGLCREAAEECTQRLRRAEAEI